MNSGAGKSPSPKGAINFSLAILSTTLLSTVLLGLFLWRMYLRWTVQCKSENRIDGKTVIITGGSSGIGKATGYELASRGARVILACRNQKLGDAVARKIAKKTGNYDVVAMYLDLSSLQCIRDFVKKVKENENKLNILINNAAYLGPKAATVDGYEKTFGVNYLGHFYLTYLLHDLLMKSAPSRIINISSNYYVKGKLDFDDLPLVNYDMFDAYTRSKLAMMHFTVEAHRMWSPEAIMSFVVHPGCVATDIMRRKTGLMGKFLRKFSEFMFKSPEDGCQTIVYCAVADGLREESGKFFENCKVVPTKNYVRDKSVCKKLWLLSLHLCGLDETHPEVKAEANEKILADLEAASFKRKHFEANTAD
ncbi:retinol dehydrogenase 12-like [Saccostrea cucullata]|uniref:retinol dehydrogenase 12-like n=1 Tax=Saccostrea cuccullata TaxID=36930 RepID=UPI002ED211A2